MMAAKSSVKLHGMWASPYVTRVLLALKVKGIKYEYKEEDLQNKSDLLLQYNPVHKKVPVLVHNGQPIAESLVILDYIDETWTNPPYLLPKDPYQRATHRFWAAYFEPEFELMGRILKTEGEAHEKAMHELLVKLDTAEEGLKKIFPSGVPSFQDHGKLGYLDIVLYSFLGTLKNIEKFFGAKLLTFERHPLLASWVDALSQVPAMKEVEPPSPKVQGFLKFFRQIALQVRPNA